MSKLKSWLNLYYLKDRFMKYNYFTFKIFLNTIAIANAISKTQIQLNLGDIYQGKMMIYYILAA